MSMSDPTDNNLLPSNGSSPEPSAQKSDLTPTELHDGHVLARFRHLPPLEADASLYIMGRDSQKAHLELLERFLLFCRRGSVLPAADAVHAVQTLTELPNRSAKGFVSGKLGRPVARAMPAVLPRMQTARITLWLWRRWPQTSPPVQRLMSLHIGSPLKCWKLNVRSMHFS